MPWFVLYTKSRSEKKVADELEKRGIDVYCPVRKIERQWSDRKKIVIEPLFRSYVFVRLHPKDRQNVFGVEGIVRYLYWLGQPAEVLPHEIQAIKDLLNDFDHQALDVAYYQPHDRLVFKSGAFSGQEGEVIHQDGQKIRVYLPSLGVQITVDASANKVGKAF